jgi:hypothetical protein
MHRNPAVLEIDVNTTPTTTEQVTNAARLAHLEKKPKTTRALFEDTTASTTDHASYRSLKKVQPSEPPPHADPSPPPPAARGPPSLRRLDHETRSGLPTDEAAAHLGRQPQTLRSWACYGNGPIEPRRVAGRLLWMVLDIKRLLGLAP